MDKKQKALSFGFVAIETVLYILILTTGGTVLWVSEFAAIALCFVYALSNIKKTAPFVPAALAFTVVADFFLVVCHPQKRLWGMAFFLCAQCVYALLLHGHNKKGVFIGVRLGLTALAVAITFAVLGGGADALAIVSMCYYANLIVNLFMAFCRFKENRLLAIGLLMFLLCDTVIGLQVASEGYLHIGEDTLLQKIIFPPFDLAWLFYLPSQALIALSAARPKKNTKKQLLTLKK